MINSNHSISNQHALLGSSIAFMTTSSIQIDIDSANLAPILPSGNSLKSNGFGNSNSNGISNGNNSGNGSGLGDNNNNNNGNNGNNGNRGNRYPNKIIRRPLSVFSGIRVDSQSLPEIPSSLAILPTGDNRVLLPGLLMRLHFKETNLGPTMEHLWSLWNDNKDLIIGCIPIITDADEIDAKKSNIEGSSGDKKIEKKSKKSNKSSTSKKAENDLSSKNATIDTTKLADTVTQATIAAKIQKGSTDSFDRDKNISWKAVNTDQLNRWGCAARIIQFSREESSIPPFSKTYAITLEGLSRFEVTEFTEVNSIFTASIISHPDEHLPTDDVDIQASILSLRQSGHNLANSLLQNQQTDSGIIEPLRHILDHTESHRLSDLLTCMLDLSLKEKLSILSTIDMRKRIEILLQYIVRQNEIISVTKKLQNAVDSEMAKKQHDYILRQKKLAIMKELGETDENDEDEVGIFSKKLKDSNLPEYVMKSAQKELSKLKKTPPTSAEYGVIRNYIELILELPWNKRTEEELNLHKAKEQLDNDHYGLEKVKKRFLEYLAVLKLNPKLHGPILCLVGPPGVGKTSLGRSIATAMGREFYRISLGGIRDEAQIRGHRRTYVGAMPGLIVQALRRVAVNNPVILLDEIDKIGSDFRGDPASALLEVLDPEQNSSFSDHYLNMPFDLSNVIFIATANSLEPIPEPLLDRMETISLSGYTIDEKVHIAKSHLVPKQILNHGMNKDNLVLNDDILVKIATGYSRESGVRVLEREISSVCRAKAVEYVEKKELQGIPIKQNSNIKATSSKNKNDESKELKTDNRHSSKKEEVLQNVDVKIIEPNDYDPVVNLETLETILGPEKYDDEISERVISPGVAVGLAWRSSGSGGILFVEATKMPGKGGLVLTGKLGDVIKESAQIGLSWVRSHWSYFNISPNDLFLDRHLTLNNEKENDKSKQPNLSKAQEFFSNYDVHIHFPAGAIPKDGPSAGVTLITAIVSLFTGVPVASHLAMTGEVSLRGLVLPVGGIKEKLIAAHRAGVKTAIIPIKNKKDLIDVPQVVKDEVTIHFAERITDVLRVAFVGGEQSGIWRIDNDGILIANSHYKWQNNSKHSNFTYNTHNDHHQQHDNHHPRSFSSNNQKDIKVLSISDSKSLGGIPKL